MNVIYVARAIVGFRTRAGCFARSTVVELIGHLHLDLFKQDCCILSYFDVLVKLILAANNFVCKSVSSQQGKAKHKTYKTVIQFDSIIVYIRQLTSEP